MPQSLSNVIVHLVFSTKNRAPFLKDPNLRFRLNSYVAATLEETGCPAILVNGVEDHIHILCNLSRTVAIAKLVEHVKTGTSKWIKEQGPLLQEFFWQGGYGIFSVSQSNVEQVRAYIAAQEEHHRKMTFEDELRALCQKHGVALDERYVWD